MALSAKSFWKQRVITALLIVLGSILILFPAWLPDHPTLPTEESAVEGLQLLLLLTSAAFWFGAARSAGVIGPFYQVMGAAGIAAAFGEGDALVEAFFNISSTIFLIPIALYICWQVLRHRRQFPLFYTEITSHPAAGFFASAFMMIYVLARALGSTHLWKATLDTHYHPDIPRTVGSYLELLACYLLLVGTIGLCLRNRKHDPTEF